MIWLSKFPSRALSEDDSPSGRGRGRGAPPAAVFGAILGGSGGDLGVIWGSSGGRDSRLGIGAFPPAICPDSLPLQSHVYPRHRAPGALFLPSPWRENAGSQFGLVSLLETGLRDGQTPHLSRRYQCLPFRFRGCFTPAEA